MASSPVLTEISPANTLTPAEWETLARVDTPTVANALDLLKARPPQQGFANRTIKRLCGPGCALMGYAVTVTMRTAAPPPHGRDVYHTIERLLEILEKAPKPAVVVIQDLDDPPVGAIFGELMAKAFRAFGAAGIVTNGEARDLAPVAQLGLSVFATGTVCAKACAHLLDINVGVTIAGLPIQPGDVLHGDENGLLSLPVELARQTARRVPDIIDAENELLTYLDTPQPTVSGFAAARRRLADRLKRT